MSNIKKLINWRELSRQLTLSGSDQNIRSNKVPKRYKEKVEKLLHFLQELIEEN